MTNKTLAEIVNTKPYPDYADWWPMGEQFLSFMATAIGTEWCAVVPDPTDLTAVERAVAQYIALVYGRAMAPNLVAKFIDRQQLVSIQSGEFDALSYAFFKTAFQTLAPLSAAHSQGSKAQHAFTQRVGKRFYRQLHEHLGLALPSSLTTAAELAQLQQAIAVVGRFLHSEGYLRDHVAFRFDVMTERAGQSIQQKAEDVVTHLQTYGVVYALYEMGYPAILPSAVYLYHTLGEAQHHSSRTIEELFDRIGYQASETADFDPTGYPSDRVVELWEIRHPQHTS